MHAAAKCLSEIHDKRSFKKKSSNPYRAESFLAKVRQAAAIIDTHFASRNLKQRKIFFPMLSTNAWVQSQLLVRVCMTGETFEYAYMLRSCNMYFKIIKLFT